ncbi:MAG: SDR family oxidoreductase, partial [Candidatus Cloacimonetes bacterium]|nr:SDR family oxidoreductase [Candidatus Cloacimonadota bacterium]
MTFPLSVSGKTILVSGAASGIGRACAIKFAEAGARLMLLDFDEEGLYQTVEMLHGEEHTPFCCDITDDAALSEVVKEIAEKSGQIHGMVQSAGISQTRP